MRWKYKVVIVIVVIIIGGYCFWHCYSYQTGGIVKGIERDVKESLIYSKQEINEAMDVAVKYFQDNFNGCKLVDIYYCGDESLDQGIAWAKNYNYEEGIVLESSFKVDGTGPLNGLNSNATYTMWQWVLGRNNNKWELITCGYG